MRQHDGGDDDEDDDDDDNCDDDDGDIDVYYRDAVATASVAA